MEIYGSPDGGKTLVPVKVAPDGSLYAVLDQTTPGTTNAVQPPPATSFAAVGAGTAITAATIANPTHIAAAVNVPTGTIVTITGDTTATPTINGTYVATNVDGTHFSIPVNVTVAGTNGSVNMQSVATTAYSVGTAIATSGYRYAAVEVFSNQAYTLYGYGAPSALSSTAAGAPATCPLLGTDTFSSCPATSGSGTVWYMRVAGFAYFLPVLYQSSGSAAIVALSASFFND